MDAVLQRCLHRDADRRRQLREEWEHHVERDAQPTDVAATRAIGVDSACGDVLRCNLFQGNAVSVAQSLPRLAHPSKESRMMLEAVLEPVVLVLESDEDPGRLTMTRNDNLAICGQAKKSR